MTSFTEGFSKTAAARAAGRAARRAAGRAKGGKGGGKGFFDNVGNFFSGLSTGAQSSGNVALKTHLNPMTGFRNLGKALDAKNTNIRGQFVGRALPSLGATAVYGYGAKKVFDGVTGNNQNQSPNYATYYG